MNERSKGILQSIAIGSGVVIGAVLLLAAIIQSHNASISPEPWYWDSEQTARVWATVKLPARVVTSYEFKAGYCKTTLIDSNGKIINIEGYGLYFEAGTIIELPKNEVQ